MQRHGSPMKAVFYLGHPAHFHMLKHVIREFQEGKHTADVLIKRKDILEDLLNSSGLDYLNILPRARTGGRVEMAWELAKREAKMFRFALVNRPDILIGTSAEIAHIGAILRRPSIILCEDDADVVPLFARVAYPFATAIVSPHVCSAGKWERKKIGYEGYQKLAYLHPNRFKPDRAKVQGLYGKGSSYFVLRLVQLNAHHDRGIRGLDPDTIHGLIALLEPHGSVHISVEGPLLRELEPYRLKTDAKDIHHVLHFADIFIGDSQSMTVEAAVLGTPAVRFNDFAGRISVLSELEEKYHLAYSVSPDDKPRLFQTVEDLLAIPNRKKVWELRREKMLRDKIDVSSFLYWLITEFPQSAQTLRADPAFEKRFQ